MIDLRLKALSLILCIGLFCLAANHAQAREAGRLNILGFSADSRHFVFEQSGVQDGSGFPYFRLYVLDLEADRYVRGTPLEEVSEIEEISLRDHMAAHRDAISDIVLPLGPLDQGEHLVARRLADGSAPSNTARFHRSRAQALSLDAGPYRLTLLTRPARTNAEFCSPDIDDIRGYQLILSSDVNDGPPRILHTDRDTIPTARDCAFDYSISDLLMAPNGESAVAIINVFSRGFEGPDRRFVTVPFVLSFDE